MVAIVTPPLNTNRRSFLQWRISGEHAAMRAPPEKEGDDERQQPKRRPMRQVAMMVNATVIDKVKPEHIDIGQNAADGTIKRPGARGKLGRFQAA